MKSKRGKVFWITGLSGSGKTEIAKKILPFIQKKYGKTVLFSGDNIRDFFFLNKYDKNSRLKYAMSYSKLCKYISDQGVNVIFATVSLFKSIRLWNKKNIFNYIEIYIDTNIDKIIKFNKKNNVYKKRKNIIGKQIKAELPEKPDVKITNNFTETTTQISKRLIKLIKKKYNA